MSTPVFYAQITAVTPALSDHYGITVSDEIRSLESLNLSISGLTFNNLSEDTCELTWVRESGDIPPFLFDDLVRIYTSEGGPEPEYRLIFLGRVGPGSESASDSDMSESFTLSGPFGDLRRHIFTRTPTGIGEVDYGDILTIGDQTVIITAGITTIDFFTTPIQVPPGYVIDARGHLFDPPWPPIPPTYRHLKDQVTELLQYIVDRLDDEPGGVTFQFDPADWAFFGADVTPKFRTFQDRNVADLLIECLSVKPDAAVWFDYSQEPPVLHIDKASEVTPTSIALGEPPVVSLRGAPRADLVVSGVVIRYDWSEWAGAGYNRGWCPTWQVDTYPPAAKADDARVVTMTQVEYVFWRDSNLAQPIYEAMSVLRFQGSLVYDDTALEAGWHPGMTLEVTGDADAINRGQLLIQSAAWNAATGQWTLTLGLPAILGIETLKDLRGWLQVSFSGPGYAFQTTLPSPTP